MKNDGPFVGPGSLVSMVIHQKVVRPREFVPSIEPEKIQNGLIPELYLGCVQFAQFLQPVERIVLDQVRIENEDTGVEDGYPEIAATERRIDMPKFFA